MCACGGGGRVLVWACTCVRACVWGKGGGGCGWDHLAVFAKGALLHTQTRGRWDAWPHTSLVTHASETHMRLHAGHRGSNSLHLK